jgi:Ca2+-binding RTX toxin-like protein
MAIRRVKSDGMAVGTSGSDKVYGDNRANVLAGAGGNDTLWGKAVVISSMADPATTRSTGTAGTTSSWVIWEKTR